MRRRVRNVDDKQDYLKWLKKNGMEILSEPDANGEVKAKCPFCDHDEFRINIRTSKFKCFRENNCGISGNAQTLVSQLGYTPLEYNSNYKKQATHTSLKLRSDDVEPIYEGNKLNSGLPKWAKELFTSRKFDYEAVKSAKVYYDGYDDTLCFPRVDLEGNVRGLKRRHNPKNKNKFTQEKGSDETFFNLHNFSGKTIYIAEGETDTLSLMSLGYIHSAVGIPSGANGSCQKWLAENYEVLENVDEIVLCLDNDNAGKKTIKSFVQDYTGTALVKALNLRDYKDVSEFYIESPSELLSELVNAKTVYSDTVVKMIDDVDDEKESVNINFTSYEYLLGGLRLGELTVILGRASSGKTSYAYQLATAIADTGIKVMIYSGEMKISKTRNWILSKMTRKNMLDVSINRYNSSYFDVTVKEDVAAFLREEYNDYIDCYDNSSWKGEDLVKDIIVQARSGHKCIILDNLSVVDVGEDEVYGMKDFFTKLRALTVMFDLHFIVVSHPRKTISEGSTLGLDDAYGSGAIGKLAFNFITISKKNDEKDSVELEVIKCREYGIDKHSNKLNMKFDRKSLRMYTVFDDTSRPTEKDRVYKWERKLPRELKQKYFGREE